VRLGLALIGVGRLGKAHARAIATLPEARLVVVADIDPDARRAGEALGARAVADAADAILATDVQAVVIVTPTDTHAAIIEIAARAGKPIFCEKPVTLDAASTQRAIAIARERDVPLQIGFQRRYDRGYAEARRRVNAGELGRIHLFRAVSHDPYPPPPLYISSCGGQFVDMAIHDIDVARFLTGSEVVEVAAWGATLGTQADAFRAANDWDTTTMMLRFGSGAVGSIVNSRQSGYGYDIHTEILGDRGGLVVGYERHTPLVRYDADGAHHDYVPYFPQRFGEAYVEELRAFVTAVMQGQPPTPTGEDGLAAIKVALAATKSAHQGGAPVPVV
jgi:myo-inositol 2-dehydrogenase/D-chiro-inositol 1-dehydrogenase